MTKPNRNNNSTGDKTAAGGQGVAEAAGGGGVKAKKPRKARKSRNSGDGGGSHGGGRTGGGNVYIVSNVEQKLSIMLAMYENRVSLGIVGNLHPEQATRTKRKAWQKLWEYTKSPEVGLPYPNVAALKKQWGNWKSSVQAKVTKNRGTGASGRRQLLEWEKALLCVIGKDRPSVRMHNVEDTGLGSQEEEGNDGEDDEDEDEESDGDIMAALKNKRKAAKDVVGFAGQRRPPEKKRRVARHGQQRTANPFQSPAPTLSAASPESHREPEQDRGASASSSAILAMARTSREDDESAGGGDRRVRQSQVATPIEEEAEEVEDEEHHHQEAADDSFRRPMTEIIRAHEEAVANRPERRPAPVVEGGDPATRQEILEEELRYQKQRNHWMELLVKATELDVAYKTTRNKQQQLQFRQLLHQQPERSSVRRSPSQPPPSPVRRSPSPPPPSPVRRSPSPPVASIPARSPNHTPARSPNHTPARSPNHSPARSSDRPAVPTPARSTSRPAASPPPRSSSQPAPSPPPRSTSRRQPRPSSLPPPNRLPLIPTPFLSIRGGNSSQAASSTPSHSSEQLLACDVSPADSTELITPDRVMDPLLFA